MNSSLKLSLITLGLLAAAPAFASTPSINWSLTGNPPASGVSELHFPMSFDVTPDAKGLYFAWFSTLSGGSRPYTGFQPAPPRVKGKHTFQSVFSSFSSVAKTNDANCFYGADGGPGVSCSVHFEAEPNRFYSNRLTATLQEGNVYYYSGDVYDDVTNQKVAHIGSFSIPKSAGAGLFRIKDSGFIEAYLKAGCSQKVSVTYGTVTGYHQGKTYSGKPITGTVPASGNCINAIFSNASGAKTTNVSVTDPQSVPQPDYAVISSKYKQDASKDNRCIRVYSGAADKAELGSCFGGGGVSNYTSMRQWLLVSEGNGFYTIRNKYKQDADKDSCLRVFSGNDNAVRIGSCKANGSAADLASMRLWKLESDGRGYYFIKNKYRQDAGKVNRCIRTYSGSTDMLQMADCNAKGGPSDYTSMRLWKYAGAM